ncbi:MAG: VCBS repeat-containing protein [Polyangiaceae bacterium]
MSHRRRYPGRVFATSFCLATGVWALACGSDDSGGAGTGGSGGSHSGGAGNAGGTGNSGGSNVGGGGGSSGGGTKNPTCEKGTSGGDVQAPVFWKNLDGETSWFASPIVMDLDKDGKNELIAAYYSVYVFDSSGTQLDKASDGGGRVYAPHVVADLEGDGVMDIVLGNDNQVLAYEWKGGKLSKKAGWPVDTTTAGNAPEVRGLAAADLNGDGKIEVVATTTQTANTEDGGAQVFVFSANGQLYPPSGISWQAWPRYNNKTGGLEHDRNGQGPPRLRPARPHRRHRQHRRRPRARDSRDLRQPPHPGVQPRRWPSTRRRGSPTATNTAASA